MSNFITDYADGTTKFRATAMNAPLQAIDKVLSYHHNTLFHCDGSITWASGTLTWSDKMRLIFISAAGNAIANEIAAGNIALSDNEYAYVDLNETNNSVLTVSKTSITTGAAAGYKGVARVVLGYRNTTSDAFYPVAIRSNLFTTYGYGVELKGYSETENSVAGASGTATCDYSLGNIHVVTIESGVDTAITFSNTPSIGKAASATLLLVMAGTVPSSITVEGASVDLTDVTSSGRIIVEATRINNIWFIGGHHAS